MDPHRASIDALKEEMGKCLEEAIDRQGGKVAIASQAGLNRATLYRLLSGKNVSTDVLLRTLRALGRNDLLAELTRMPEPSPLERLPHRATRSLKFRDTERGPSLIGQLKLGKPPKSAPHG